MQRVVFSFLPLCQGSWHSRLEGGLFWYYMYYCIAHKVAERLFLFVRGLVYSAKKAVS